MLRPQQKKTTKKQTEHPFQCIFFLIELVFGISCERNCWKLSNIVCSVCSIIKTKSTKNILDEKRSLRYDHFNGRTFSLYIFYFIAVKWPSHYSTIIFIRTNEFSKRIGKKGKIQAATIDGFILCAPLIWNERNKLCLEYHLTSQGWSWHLL